MQQPMAPQPHPMGGAVPVVAKKKRSLSPIQYSIGALLFAIAILITLVLVFTVIGGGKSTDSAVNKDKYQAVFLSSQDGQVYFGKLETFNQNYYKLSDIFYVRVENKIQPEGAQSSTQSQQSISLAKLGNELHGPEDTMYINRDQVLFWENLKEDGQVVKAIREYQKDPAAATKQNDAAAAEQNANTGTTTNTTTDTTKKP